jgi:hypothetical protein
MKNKLIINLILSSLLFTVTACKGKKKNPGVIPEVCNVLDTNSQGNNQCGNGEIGVSDPFPVETGNSETPSYDPSIDNDTDEDEFVIVSSSPLDLVNNFHVDDKIIISFNNIPDQENITINSGSDLDLIALTNEQGEPVQIDIEWNRKDLIIKSRYSLIPNEKYDLEISSELRDNFGNYLDSNFYLSFYTQGEPVNPGTKLRISWTLNPEYEERGFGNYKLSYDVKSNFNEQGQKIRNYDHLKEFTSSDADYTDDYDLGLSFYNVELDLVSQTKYHLVINVCNDDNLCTGNSDEATFTTE